MRFALLSLIVSGFLLGALMAWFIHAPHAVLPAVNGQGKVLIGGRFQLVGLDGNVVTDKDFRGRPFLIYFCYTYSLDICPAGLQTLSQVLTNLSERGKDIPAIFVTFDPERDTSQRMRAFLGSYHPGIVALRGEPEQIRAAADRYRVLYAQDSEASVDENYQMRHTAYIYFMDGSAEYLAHFNHGKHPSSIVKSIIKYL